MDEKALISQISEMMDMQTQELIKYIDGRFAAQGTKFTNLVEEKVTRRLDSLTDGYKSVHEKQWDLERQNEQLMALVDDLQNRVSALEHKTA